MNIEKIDFRSAVYADFAEGKNLFLQPKWLDYFQPEAESYLIRRGRESIAAFHLYRYKSMGGTYLISAPFAQNIGLQINYSSLKNYNFQSETKRVMRVLTEFLTSQEKNSFLDLSLPPTISDIQPAQWAGLKTSVKYTYLLSLDNSEMELLAGMSAERRKNIRQSEKNNYEIRKNSDPLDVLILVRKSMRRAGEFFHDNVLENMCAENHLMVDWFTVYKSGVPLATVIFASDQHTAYYLAGGHDATMNDSNAGSYAMWLSLCEAKNSGRSTFNFMGSSVPAIEQYFRHFGGKLTPYFKLERLPASVKWIKKIKRTFAN